MSKIKLFYNNYVFKYLKNLYSIITNPIDNFISNKNTNNNIITITIPNNIIYRSQLICNLISHNNNYEYNLNNLITNIFNCFMDKNIKQYNPKNVLNLLINNNNISKTIILKDLNNSYKINQNKKITLVNIYISDSIYNESNLILNEIYDLYGYKADISDLIQSLWISFINDYKNGNNSKAYYKINKLISA